MERRDGKRLGWSKGVQYFSLWPSRPLSLIDDKVQIISARKATLAGEEEIMGKTMGKDRMVSVQARAGRTDSESRKEGIWTALAKMKDEDIDYSDIPEQTEEMWRNAVRGNPFFQTGEEGSLIAAGCGCDCVAQEGRRRLSDAGEQYSAGAHAAGRLRIREIVMLAHGTPAAGSAYPKT